MTKIWVSEIRFDQKLSGKYSRQAQHFGSINKEWKGHKTFPQTTFIYTVHDSEYNNVWSDI
jgi:hypothetical protein